MRVVLVVDLLLFVVVDVLREGLWNGNDAATRKAKVQGTFQTFSAPHDCHNDCHNRRHCRVGCLEFLSLRGCFGGKRLQGTEGAKKGGGGGGAHLVSVCDLVEVRKESCLDGLHVGAEAVASRNKGRDDLFACSARGTMRG